MPSSLFRGISIPVLASAARTTSSNTGSLKDLVTDIPVAGALSWYVNLTAFTGDNPGLDGLQVYLDHSPDNGTTWLNFGKFARLTTSTGTRVINMRRTGIGAVEAASEAAVFSTTTSVAVATNTVLTADIRVRWTLGDGTLWTAAPTATFSVWCIAQPMGGGAS